MKKINLLIAAGLLASASMQAQVVSSLGFENSDPKERTSQWALNHQAGSFGDWVNKKDDDVWVENNEADVHGGEYAFMAVNAGEPGVHLNTWDRGFKYVLGDGVITENTPYRVTFWVKGPEGGKLVSGLSQGTENFDKRICSPSGADYAAGGNDGFTTNGGWQLVSYCVFFTNSASLNGIIENQSWVGNATFPEDFGGDGTKTYAEYFEHQLPNEFFFIANMRTSGTWFLDDIVIEKGVTYNQVSFGCTTLSSENVVKFDFGYPTNIAKLAEASETGSLSLDPSCVTITVDGAPATVKYLEGKSDGFLYAFLDLGDEVYLEGTENVVASFTPAADCPIIYSSDRRPSADVESEMKVLAIANAAALSDEDISITSVEAGSAKVVSTNPENESFEIDASTFNKISITYDKELDPMLEMASARISWANGTQEKNLTPNLSLSEDGKTLNIAIDWTLEDGEYTVEVFDVETKFYAACPDVNLVFAVGPDNDQTVSEEVYSTNATFAETANGTFPVGWVANDNGTIHQYGLTEQGAVWNYNWGGNVGGGGCRAMTGYSGDLNGAAIYWRCMNGNNALGTLTFGAQVNDHKLIDGTIDPEMDPNIALWLDAKKHQITIRMCAWKNLNGNQDAVSAENAPLYDFTLEDLEGNVYARFSNVKAMPNVNGAQDKAVNNVTKSVTDFTVETPGYYVLKFSTTQTNAELLLGGVDIITMPSKAAYWKQQLAAAAKDAEGVLDTAEDSKYDGDTKTALQTAYNSATTGHFTTPSEIQALIDEMKADATKLQTRMKNIDDFVAAVEGIGEMPEGLEGKYLEADIVKDAVTVIEGYKDVNPSTLSDEELADVTPRLASATEKLQNAKGVVDALTWGITKAILTYNTIGTDDAAALALAAGAVTDDRNAADQINEANRLRVLQILGEELVEGNIPEEYLTTMNDTIKGIELTGCIQNPKLYRQLNVDGVPGWNVEAGSDTTSLNISYAGDAPSENKPVTDQYINIYGNADYNLSQIVKNLPVGIYTVKFSTRTPQVDKTEAYGKIFYYNAQNDETGEWDKYIYAGEDGVAPYRGGSWGYGSDANDTFIENIEVGEDGTVLIGAREHYCSGKAEKHEDNTPQSFWTGTTMCDDVRIFLTAPMPGYDYPAAYATGVETVEVAKANQNGAIYNIAGQRVNAGYKGIVIKNGKKYLMK